MVGEIDGRSLELNSVGARHEVFMKPIQARTLFGCFRSIQSGIGFGFALSGLRFDRAFRGSEIRNEMAVVRYHEQT